MMFFSRAARFIQLFIHLSHTTFQMLYGAWRISSLRGPIVTIFGSARLKQDTFYTQKAHELGQRFLDNGISVLTGGGTGIMEAASCYISSKGDARSIGIGVRGLEDRPALCGSEYFELEYFFARKWLLTEYSIGFIIFPGGFGTLDEMAGVLTLIQTKKLKQLPVVLIGKEYWAPFIDWVQNEALGHGAILKEELEFFYVTDDLDDTFCWVLGKCDVLRK